MVFDDLELTITKIYKYCLKLSASPWMAEDLVQDTMLKVYKIKSAEPKRELTFSFLCTVAKNLFIDEKRKKREMIYFNEEFYGETSNSLEHESLIEILLTTLPLQQAMLITLKDVFGYTSKEIAIMLRVSNESIKTALHRSRKKLKTAKDIDKYHEVPNHQIIVALSKAIKESKPKPLFFYYRLLAAQNFQVRRGSGKSVCHVIDPDGNILELLSS